MNRRILIVAALAAMASLIAFAADKPNFSGTWKINSAKSDFGPMPAPETFERTIDHKDPEMKIKTVQSVQGNERTSEIAYTIDGAPHNIKLGMGEAQVTAQWKGSSMEVSSKREIQGNEIKSIEVWSLSEDGKTLTTESTINAPQGEFKIKLVLDKQ